MGAEMNNILLQCTAPWVVKFSEEEKLEQVSWTVILNGENMKSGSEFYEEISKQFQFPAYFGSNLNALKDMLSDLSWLERPFYAILVKNSCLLLCEEDEKFLSGFLDTLSLVGEEWSKSIEEGEPWDRPCKPFHVFLQVGSHEPSEFKLIPFAEW